MKEMLSAMPKFNRKSGKWNIVVKTDSGEIKLGHGTKADFCIFHYTEFECKKDAISYIEQSEGLVLKR